MQAEGRRVHGASAARPHRVSPHRPAARACGAGLAQQQTGTTVTYTLTRSSWTLLTVARSRLREVINDQMESLTELQTDFADQPMPLSRAERR